MENEGMSNENILKVYRNIIESNDYWVIEDWLWGVIRDKTEGRVILRDLFNPKFVNREDLKAGNIVTLHFGIGRVRDILLYVNNNFIEGKDYELEIYEMPASPGPF